MNNRHGLVETGKPGGQTGSQMRNSASCQPAPIQNDSSTADLVDRVGHLGEQSRITESGAGDKRAELDPLSDSRERGRSENPSQTPSGSDPSHPHCTIR